MTCLLRHVTRQAPCVHPTAFSFNRRGARGDAFRNMRINRLSSSTLVSCLQRENVGVRLTGERYGRLQCRCRNGACFIINFPGVTNNCRLHGHCFGKYVTPGSVARVQRRNGRQTIYCLFRNFVSCLSFLAVQMGGGPRRPHAGRRSCVMLGSIAGLSGTRRLLHPCSQVKYFLSGSRTKRETCRGLGGVFKGELRSVSRRCGRRGSLRSCLYRQGRTGRTRGGSRIRSTVQVPRPRPGGGQNFEL